MSEKQLLQVTGDVIDELVSRGVCRTENNPVSDYTEWLVASRLNITLATSSARGFDAVGPNQEKYEIKARRITPKNQSRQLSAIRNLDLRLFDFLVAVVYTKNFEVKIALKIPYEVVVKKSKKVGHTNSHKLEAKDDLIAESGVEDITHLLK